MKRIAVLALALVMMLGALVACGNDIHAKSEGVMTHAEYTAAAKGDEVVIEAFVQATQEPGSMDLWRELLYHLVFIMYFIYRFGRRELVELMRLEDS